MSYSQSISTATATATATATIEAINTELRDLLLLSLHHQFYDMITNILAHYLQHNDLSTFLDLALIVITVVARDDVPTRVRASSLSEIFVWVTAITTNWRMQSKVMDLDMAFGITDENVGRMKRVVIIAVVLFYLYIRVLV